MVTPAKRKRAETAAQVSAPETSQAGSAKNIVEKAATTPTWPELLKGIQGDKGEPGAITALLQFCRILREQAAVAATSAKKTVNDPVYLAYNGFLEYWQKDADLKILVAVWERGDQAGNTALTVAVLQTYATLLSISTRSSTGFAAIGSPYQGTLAKFVSSLVGLLHYVKPYLHQQGKNELATAALDMLNALLHLIRMSSARNATARKVWVSLNLDSKVICRLLGTKRKVPLITKHGRRADIRHLMLDFLSLFCSPTMSVTIQTDIFSTKGVISCIWKNLSDDPIEVIDSVLETMGICIASPRLPVDLRCRLAEDAWAEAIKIYETTVPDTAAPSDLVYSSAQRFLYVVILALARPPRGANGMSPVQRKTLGSLIGRLDFSDSEPQAEMALHVLACAPELLGTFWPRFVPSLEPRLSSRWITSIGFASRIVSSALPSTLHADTHLPSESSQHLKHHVEKAALPSLATLLDCCTIPGTNGKLWVSKALQQYSTTPLVTYLTCRFLLASLVKADAVLDCLQNRVRLESTLEGKDAWITLSRKFKEAIRERLPELQILIALAQKGLGRVFSRAGSVASVSNAEDKDGDGQPEDNTMILSLVLRTLRLYRQLDPRAFASLRFDFGKLLTTPFFSPDPADVDQLPIIAIGQAALLDLIAPPMTSTDKEGSLTWAWHKASETGQSPLASIFKIYLASRTSLLGQAAGKAAKQILSSSLLFDHDTSEPALWLSAMSAPEEQDLGIVLNFIDSCIQRCMSTPYRYVDQLAALVPHTSKTCASLRGHTASPLLATVFEQMQHRFSRAPHNDTYELELRAISAFMQNLIISLCGHKDCLCLVTALSDQVVKVAQMCESPAKRREALVIANATQSAVYALVGRLDSRSPGADEMTGCAKSLFDFVHSLTSGSPVPAQQALQAIWKTNGGSVEQCRSSCQLCLHILQHHSSDTVKKRAIRYIAEYLDHQDSSRNLDPLKEVYTSCVVLDTFRESLETDGSIASDIVDLLQCNKDAVTPSVFVTAALSSRSPVAVDALRRLIPSSSFLHAHDALLSVLTLNNTRLETLHASLIVVACQRLLQLPNDSLLDNTVGKYWQKLLESEKLVDQLSNCPSDVIARTAEMTLPVGLWSSGTDDRCQPHQDSDISWLGLAATIILNTAQWNSGRARIVAVAVLRGSIALSQVEAINSGVETYQTFEPIYLSLMTVKSAKNIPGQIDSWRRLVAPTIDAWFSAIDGEAQSKVTHVLVYLATDPDLQDEIVISITRRLRTNEGILPTLFSAQSLEATLQITRKIDQHTTDEPLLNIFSDESLRWLVRRFAEDVTNTTQVQGFIQSLTAILAAEQQTWTPKIHLAEPVIVAGLQNRFNDVESLAFLTQLIRRTDLPVGSLTRMAQTILADNRLRQAFAKPSAIRSQAALLLEATLLKELAVLDTLDVLPTLIALYGGTLSCADQAILHIMRAAEALHSTSLRSIIKLWVPLELRGVAVDFQQVLSGISADSVHKACVYILDRTSSDRDASGVADPAFMLPYINAIIDGDNVERIGWLSLIRSNALGLAFCAIASPSRQYQLAGDRILAKARNALQSADFREKDEILLAIEVARNTIPATMSLDDTTSTLIPLFMVRALHSISSPEHFSYPLIQRFLLSRPVLDVKDVPLLYNLFYSSSEDSFAERRWLIELLTDSAHCSEDWKILRRRQVLDLMATLMSNDDGRGAQTERISILRLFAAWTGQISAARDLLTKHDFINYLGTVKAASLAESRLLLTCIDNCIIAIQPGKLRRARDGLWILEVLNAIHANWSQDFDLEIVQTISHASRRLAWHMGGSDQPDTIDAGLSPLAQLCQWLVDALASGLGSARIGQQEPGLLRAVRNTQDAVLRLDYIQKRWGDTEVVSGELVEAATLLALRAGIEGVKTEIIRSWHTGAS